MRRRAADPIGRTAAMLAAAVLAACGGGDPADETEAGGTDDRPWVADTQYFIDSTGARLQIVIGRPAGDVRELVPRAGSGDAESPDAFRILEPRIAHSMMQASRPEWYVIDLRPPAAYVTEGHIRGAKLVPIEALEENLLDLHVRDDQVVFLYADGTARARDAARLLAGYGYPHVRVLGGGFPAWKREGLPVEESS